MSLTCSGLLTPFDNPDKKFKRHFFFGCSYSVDTPSVGVFVMMELLLCSLRSLEVGYVSSPEIPPEACLGELASKLCSFCLYIGLAK